MLAAALLAGLVAPAAVPTPYDLVRAESLIRFPELAADTPPPPRDRLAAAAVAGRLGLLTGHEYLAWDECPAGVYYALRGFLEELDGCPPLADADRLPPWRWCDAAAEFNRGLARGWRSRIEWEPDRAAVLEAAALEAERYATFWAAAGWAGFDQAPPHRRRVALRTVRGMMAPADYAAGRWPDAGPFDLLRPR